MNNLFILLLQLSSVLVVTALAARSSSRGRKGTLTCWIVLQALLANLFVLKPIDLFGLSCSPSDAFAVGSMISLNLLQQQEGKKEASFASILSLIVLGAFALFAELHLLFVPYHEAAINDSYHAILSNSPRLLAASMGAFFLSQRFDLFLFGWISRTYPKAHFAYKTIPTALLSQTFDTALFTFFGLYGLLDGLLSIFVISSLTKWITAIFLGSLTSLFALKTPKYSP